MPKKRHQTIFSKPQSTAPASLSSSSTGSRNQHDDQSQSSSSRSVNQLLADLRRVGLNGSGGGAAAGVHPTVPPAIRDILQLPETPAPRPRGSGGGGRPARLDAAGRRLPPGPAPPRSWLSSSTSSRRIGAPRDGGTSERSSEQHHRPLPGAYLPERGSLVDMVLRRFALDWEFQRIYCQYYLYDLPTHLRVALVRYVGVWGSDSGVSLADLQILLSPLPMDGIEDGESGISEEISPSTANEAFTHLDLTGSVGRSLRLRELSDLLLPPQQPGKSAPDLQDSWDDAPDDQPAAVSVVTIPRPLLPNLTHLSLALNPDAAPPATTVSWRHLLAFAASHSYLTHLSLAFWPEPSLTPDAKYASVVSAQGRVVQYGGTGPYSHSLDNDWSEAVMVARRLSKSLYELEYLDLTGCAGWSPALWSSAEHDVVDWVGQWGKISTILLYPGYELGEAAAGIAETARYRELVGNARRLERHVRSCRAGRGTFITVETSKMPDHGRLG
ncbi:hypothetical protein B0H66DRAFT_623999 [Apodospora peruviana]|uniref:Tafazzin n=1 Tax=Apodospora peruviana TaxID=516989 RepID=A0AAE0I6B9_9PEZI|nr:hypothetical protein B0H66DRAFT_623999 [Apodospora peruviana]